MDKFIGILFFYTVTFFNKKKKYDTDWVHIEDYVNEKSIRYLNKYIEKSQWEMLKTSLRDYPEPDSNDIFEHKNIIGIIDIFYDIFKEVNYELRMYGIEESQEKKVIDECYDNFDKFVEILGSSNGVSIVLGDWLSRSKYDRKIIERKIKLLELIK